MNFERPDPSLLEIGSGSDTKYPKKSSGLDCNCQLEVCPRYDFGDAPISYGTLFGGPQHLVTGPRLGAAIDSEPNGQPSSGATGDDTAGVDDEDGVTITGLMVGSVATAQVVLGTPGSAKLDAWIDFNNNGVFGPGEQIFASATIAAGTNTLSFAVPVTAVAGGSYARFRVSTTGSLGPTGLAGPGEVEDYRVDIAPPRFDFGDAPDSYSTLLGSNGPRHTVGGPRLGVQIDVETNGAPSVGATGDDAAGVDDEDGLAMSALVPGGTTTVAVTLNNALTARLDAWIDFNKNGVFDPFEQIFSSVVVNSGTNNLAYTVPTSASSGLTFARFRISSAGGLAPSGLAADGEVEDHFVDII